MGFVCYALSVTLANISSIWMLFVKGGEQLLTFIYFSLGFL